METTHAVDEELSVPEIRERLRRAYRRLAREVQKRAATQAMVQVSASSSAVEEHAPHEERRQVYTQERMF